MSSMGKVITMPTRTHISLVQTACVSMAQMIFPHGMKLRYWKKAVFMNTRSLKENGTTTISVSLPQTKTRHSLRLHSSMKETNLLPSPSMKTSTVTPPILPHLSLMNRIKSSVIRHIMMKLISMKSTIHAMLGKLRMVSICTLLYIHYLAQISLRCSFTCLA